MFAGKSTTRNSTTTTTKQKHLDIGDIEHLLHDSLTNNEGDEADINENDLNDPELLAQLNALASSSSQPAKKETATTKQAGRPPQAQRQQKADDMEIDWDTYAALAQPENDDIQVELNENDFNDPHLLNELSAISSTAPMDVDKPQSEGAEPNETDGSVSQLMNMGFSRNQAKKALEMFDNDMGRATNFLLDSPPSNNDNDDMEAKDQRSSAALSPPPAPPPHHYGTSIDSAEQHSHTIDEHTDPPLSSTSRSNLDDFADTMDLKERAKLYQQHALRAKKQGNMKEAVSLLRESKLLMQQYQLEQQQESLDHNSTPLSTLSQDTETPPLISSTTEAATTEATTIPSPISASSPAPSPAPSPALPSTTAPAPPSAPAPSPALIKAQQELLQRVIQLQKEYKDAAHHYKNLGNLAVTKEMIQISKSLLKTGIQVKQQQLSEQEVDQTTKRLPDHPDLFLGNGKLRSAQPVTEFNQPTVEQMEAQLVYQIDICHNLDIQRQTGPNSKTSPATQQTSLLPLKQAFAADLVTLRASKEQQGDSTLPPLHYEQVDYAYKNILDHLPANQMELKIMQGTGIQSLDIGTTVEPFVSWDFSGWPPENTAQAQLNKGETPVMKGSEPAFDFTVLIPITRTNRVFMRHLQRKRLLLEVFHNKYNYGFLRRPMSIGKVAIPLDTLLTKTLISGWFDLLDTNRKKTGGKLKIQLGLREPLNGQDIVSKSERWLVLDGLGQQTSQLMHSVGLTAAPCFPTSPSNAPPAIPATIPAIPSPVQATPSPAQATPPQTQGDITEPSVTANSPAIKKSAADSTNSELESAEEEIDSVDSLVSNMVLDHEINVATIAISKATDGSSSSPRTKEDWLDRKQALDIKMNMLVIQVQTGMLDMQTYLDNVEQRMNRDRHLALVFKKHNRLDLAKLALARKKIMQDELDEAKAAMAAQEEE